MEVRDFIYWVRGYFEIAKNSSLGLTRINREQLVVIEQHLILVKQRMGHISLSENAFLSALSHILDTYLQNLNQGQLLPFEVAKNLDKLIEDQFKQMTKPYITMRQTPVAPPKKRGFFSRLFGTKEEIKLC